MNEFKEHKDACVRNLIREIEHLKEYLKDKDEGYILCNPEEAAHELIDAGISAAQIIGAYEMLDMIEDTGMVPTLTFNNRMEQKMSKPDISKMLRNDLVNRVNENGYADIGTGAEAEYGVSRERFNRVVKTLQKNGYLVDTYRMEDGTRLKLLSLGNLNYLVPKIQGELIGNRMYLKGLKLQNDTLKSIQKYDWLIKGFDPGFYHDPVVMISQEERNFELKRCRKLIGDMVYKGAPDSEIGMVVAYSMVIIDAKKKQLNWLKAEEDFGIKMLEIKYGQKGEKE